MPLMKELRILFFAIGDVSRVQLASYNISSIRNASDLWSHAPVKRGLCSSSFNGKILATHAELVVIASERLLNSLYLTFNLALSLITCRSEARICVVSEDWCAHAHIRGVHRVTLFGDGWVACGRPVLVFILKILSEPYLLAHHFLLGWFLLFVRFYSIFCVILTRNLLRFLTMEFATMQTIQLRLVPAMQ